MEASDKAFTGSIPVLYERHLGPLMFEPYAADLAGRLSATSGGRVLETAAGTGIATRAIRARLPAAVTIVATDLNPAMIDFARTRPTPGVEWRQADACALPFEDTTFDAVACQFGVMFFPDKAKGFAEARRVLKPAGRFLFNVWDGLPANDFARTVHEAVAACFPKDPPGFFARAPHGYHNTGAIEATLKQAGFAQVRIDPVEHRSRAPSPRHAAIGYCQGSPLRNEIEARDPAALDGATDAAAGALAAHFGDGPIEGRMRAYMIEAMR